jgi:hypothetical protein
MMSDAAARKFKRPDAVVLIRYYFDDESAQS